MARTRRTFHRSGTAAGQQSPSPAEQRHDARVERRSQTAATIQKTKGMRNQRKFLVRRRSSKPLVINPSVVNDEVTSGTAARLVLAVAVSVPSGV